MSDVLGLKQIREVEENVRAAFFRCGDIDIQIVEDKKRLGGVDPVKAVEDARANLEAADVKQERAIQDLPGDTLEIYEAKGRALLLLADLNDAGHNAFDGAPEAGKFNKDLVLRARKERAKVTQPPA